MASSVAWLLPSWPPLNRSRGEPSSPFGLRAFRITESSPLSTYMPRVRRRSVTSLLKSVPLQRPSAVRWAFAPIPKRQPKEKFEAPVSCEVSS